MISEKEKRTFLEWDHLIRTLDIRKCVCDVDHFDIFQEGVL